MINASTPHTQSTLGSQRYVSNDELLQFINRKFDDITKRLQTLEDLETKVNEVVSKLSRLCVNIAILPLVKKAKDDNKCVYIRYNKLMVDGREYTGGKYGPLQ